MKNKNKNALFSAILAVIFIVGGFYFGTIAKEEKKSSSTTQNIADKTISYTGNIKELSIDDLNKIREHVNVPYLLSPLKYQEIWPVDNPLCKSPSLIEENFKLKVYTACNDLAKQEGLKMVKSMPKDQGMLFVYPEERELNFWMNQTYLPLSIAYLDKDFKVVKTAEMIPLDRTGIDSIVPAKYALELNAGMMKELGIEEGVTLSFKNSDEFLDFIPEQRFEDQDYELQLYIKYHQDKN